MKKTWAFQHENMMQQKLKSSSIMRSVGFFAFVFFTLYPNEGPKVRISLLA